MTPTEQYFYYTGFAANVFIIFAIIRFSIGEFMYWLRTLRLIKKAIKGELKPKDRQAY